MTGRNPESFTFGPFQLLIDDGLWRGASEVPLPPRALAVLSVLVQHAGAVVSKAALMNAVWPDTFVTESSLMEAVGLVRDALGDDRRQPAYIQTVHRRGYRFVAAVREERGERPAPPRPFFDRPEWHPIWRSGVAAALATISVALAVALFGKPLAVTRPSRLSIALPVDAALDRSRGALAVSGDGTRLVYVAMTGGRQRLVLRTVDRDEPMTIDGTDGASDPFFSPDGEWIGFFAHGSLQSLRLSGGTPTVVCAARGGAGASWGSDGTMVFGGGPSGGLARVSARGGDPVEFTAPGPGSREVRYGWPDILPSGRGIIYTAVHPAGSDVAVFDLKTGARSILVPDASFGRYAPTGDLIVERHGQLEAARFSLATLTLMRSPSRLLAGVAHADAFMDGGPRFAFSMSGSLIYVPDQTADEIQTLRWLEGGGGREHAAMPAVVPGAADLSPDARRVALTLPGEGGADVWVGDLVKGGVSRLTRGGRSMVPSWRPDGLAIAFADAKAGPFNLFVMPIEGGGPAVLATSPWNQVPTSWAPDGRRLAFTQFEPSTGADIWTLDVRTREPRPLVRTLFDETGARFSPNGRWVAYMSNETGRWETYVSEASGTGPRVRVSMAGGQWPSWSFDSETLYFSADGSAMSASIRAAPTLTAANAVEVASAGFVLPGGSTARDRLLVGQPDGAGRYGRELRIVIGWFADVTRRGGRS